MISSPQPNIAQDDSSAAQNGTQNGAPLNNVGTKLVGAKGFKSFNPCSDRQGAGWGGGCAPASHKCAAAGACFRSLQGLPLRPYTATLQVPDTQISPRGVLDGRGHNDSQEVGVDLRAGALCEGSRLRQPCTLASPPASSL